MTDTVTTTDRLILRDWRLDDEARFYAIMNTAPVMRWLGGVQTPAKWHAAFERIAGFQRDFGHTFWIAERKPDGGHLSGELLGFCGLKRVNAGGTDLTGQHEIGWRLREAAWGHGYATEAAIASLDLAFTRYAAPHAVALTVAGNDASRRLMEKLRMTRRADLDFTDPRYGPELNPTIVYRIEGKEWLSSRSGH
ncbi:GNAT family N-acetyltransferase [Sphingomonas sp.]|uniref:GNAT family N-acetyltransferase n=1 Tax=Sphingomonas sp. TaxID=28214 RepID=UPI0025F6D69A|nr:GNAT family N-acetyltransferase [Sphingomonas sp.]